MAECENQLFLRFVVNILVFSCFPKLNNKSGTKYQHEDSMYEELKFFYSSRKHWKHKTVNHELMSESHIFSLTGDRLLEVDGVSFQGFTYHQAVGCLSKTGEVNFAVLLAMLHEVSLCWFACWK